MKAADLKALRVGGDIVHTRYGVCEIRDILYSLGGFFGIVIHPKTDNGKYLLKHDSGTNIANYMEDSLRSLLLA